MKINEIFYSLQGEGRYTGTPAVFVRFAGCNLRCDFCDTSHESFEEYTEDKIVDAVSRYPSPHVILTGGEPTLQITDTLLAALHRSGRIIHIETNGTRALDDNMQQQLDWITVSPKFGIPPVIGRIDELKAVFDAGHPEFIRPLEEIDITHSDCRYLQPCDRGDARLNEVNLRECIRYILRNPRWKLSLQTHKLLGIQ